MMLRKHSVRQDCRCPSIEALRIVILSFVVWTSSASATMWQVPGSFADIQTAINASATIDGDTIELTTTLYTGSGNRNIDFLGKAITIRSQSGDPNLCTIDCAGIGRGFRFHSNEGSESVLCGITITNGYADGNAISDGGAGMHCTASSPTCIDCIIKGNAAENDGGGGGVKCVNASPTFIACHIVDNHSNHVGGAVFIVENSSPIFTTCAIRHNDADRGGGGIQFSGSSASCFVECDIDSNFSGRDGGGVCCLPGCSAQFTGCTISANTASLSGGGIWVDGLSSSPVFWYCRISGNRSGWPGGGVSLQTCSPTFENCLIDNNDAWPWAGGIFDGSAARFVNCTIAFNSANYGANIYAESSQSSYSSCIVTNGSIALDNCEYADFRYCDLNCDLWDVDESVGAGPPGIGEMTSVNVNGDSCDVYNNIAVDPLLTDPLSHDYHLADLSSCIGAGDPSAPPAIDLDGNPRPNPPGSITDIGAFESLLGIPDSECDSVTFITWDWFQFCSNNLQTCVHLCHDYYDRHIIFIGPFPQQCRFMNYSNGLIIRPGCNYGPEGCNEPDCMPATDWLYDPQFWDWYEFESEWFLQMEIYLTGDEGCVCVQLSDPLNYINPDCWLPAELMSLTAFPANNSIRIEFTTASETDNDHFEIWKSQSETGDFVLLTELESQGQSALEQHYSYLDRDVANGHTYWYYLADVDLAGRRTEHREHIVSAHATASPIVPKEYALTSYPNPFNPETTIRYAITESSPVKLSIHDVLGRQIALLINEEQAAGVYDVTWNAASFPTGIYLCRMQAGPVQRTHKLLLVK